MRSLRVVTDGGSIAPDSCAHVFTQRLGCPRSVIVVGASATGKTTLIDGLRREDLADRLAIPRRYVTRPARSDDEATENVSVGVDAFEALINAGSIAVHWSRRFERDRLERYGFQAIPPTDRRLLVYSGNNALLIAREPSVVKLIRNSLVVILTSSRATREERLSRKQMQAEERRTRLEDPVVNIGRHGVQVIDTSMLTPGEGQAAFRGVIDQIVSERLAA